MITRRAATRIAAKRNLLCAALDVAFRRGLVKYDDTHRSFEFQLADMRVLACVRADDSEIAVLAIVNPTALGRRFSCCCLTSRKRQLFGAAFAVGWLNRRTGRFVEVSNDFRASDAAVRALAQMTFTKALTAERPPSIRSTSESTANKETLR